MSISEELRHELLSSFAANVGRYEERVQERFESYLLSRELHGQDIAKLWLSGRFGNLGPIEIEEVLSSTNERSGEIRQFFAKHPAAS